jgi:hypothetical protein
MRLPLLFLTVLALAGCRNAIVDPELPGVDPSNPSTQAEIAIKGPRGTLRAGVLAQLRAQPVPRAARYEWTFFGPGSVQLNGSVVDRVLEIRGATTGEVTAAVRALDASGTGVGSGELVFTVEP